MQYLYRSADTCRTEVFKLIVKLPRMNKDEIRELLRGQTLCRIAFKGEEYPYMAPFQYLYHGGCLYFHFTNYGKKMKLIDRDNRVCVEIESYEPDLSEYSFVVLTGRLDYVTDEDERATVIRKMAEEGRRRLSERFLAAHGLDPEDGWSSLDPGKPLRIVKLVNIVGEIGLRSPR